MAKRAREQAVKEKRDRKREKKAERAAAKNGPQPDEIIGEDGLLTPVSPELPASPEPPPHPTE